MYNIRNKKISIIYKTVRFYCREKLNKWKLSSLSELTPMIFNMGLTNLASKGSIYHLTLQVSITPNSTEKHNKSPANKIQRRQNIWIKKFNKEMDEEINSLSKIQRDFNTSTKPTHLE